MLRFHLNPFLVRLVGNHIRLGLAVTTLIALGLGITILAYGIWAFDIRFALMCLDPMDCSLRPLSWKIWASSVINLSDTLVVLSVLLILFVPGVIILIAMSFTTRYIISADAELVRLTALLEHSMVSGYTFAVLYRARYLLALSLAMTPALMLIVSSAYRSKYFIWHAVEFLRNDVWLAYWSERPHYGTLIVSSSQENLLAWLIWVGGMWGLNWLAASSGVALAIKRQFFLGNIIAPLFLLTVALCLMWVFISAELTASESVLFRNALLPALSYPLAFAVIRLASRWMRRT